MTAVTGTRPQTVSGSRRSTVGRELNAVAAIAWREILRAAKSPLSLAFTVLFPIIFIGILGGSISQNLGGALSYAYLPYMLIGMVANAMYQGTIAGVTNLVEERENDFTAELFVAPISRYAVLVGKLIGSVVAVGVPLLIFPQIFLSGALIPVAASTGILGLLAKVIPMTYSIDLARNIYYWGKPEYAAAVLHPPMVDLAVTVGFILVFVIVGTTLFVRSDRNR
jgi:ABC-2 type transport system permease protein